MAIDSHMHINSIVLEKVKISDYINEIINNPDIKSVINVGLNIDTSNESLLISKINSNFYSTIGIHPLYIESQNVESLYELGTCDRVVAIGEIGLDSTKNNFDEQKSYLIKQIIIANELHLPVVIHANNTNKLIMKNFWEFHFHAKKKHNKRRRDTDVRQSYYKNNGIFLQDIYVGYNRLRGYRSISACNAYLSFKLEHNKFRIFHYRIPSDSCRKR